VLRAPTPFEAALRERYYAWGSLGYCANRFFQKFSPHCKLFIGGVEAVRSVLPYETAGFRFLRKHGYLSLSVEALMLERQWRHLFTESELAIAAQKIGRKSK
jgi:hypothetical protein